MNPARRIRYEAIVCCDCSEGQLRDAGAEVVAELTARYGGASMLPCTGGWAVNGNATVEQYDGVAVHSGIMIILTVTSARADEAYTDLASTIANAVRQHKIPARFIHVDRLETQALHFEVNTLDLCGTHDTVI